MKNESIITKLRKINKTLIVLGNFFIMVFTVAKLSDVFISGGQPTVTYNPRSQLHLEDKLDEYLDVGHKILAITGPTKSGKTVLVRSRLNLENSCWISGGQISEESDFWESIIDKYEGYTDYSNTESDSMGVDEELGLDGGINLKLLNIGGKSSTVQTTLSGQTYSKSRKLSPKTIVTRLLNENIHVPMIIDDFHYIDQIQQMKIIRYLKDLVFNGLRVIIISVPHRAYDAVKVEREMTGRLTQLEIPIWEKDELELIMRVGFEELNVEVPTELTDSFAEESFGSPHLTQDFCYKFCNKNGIKETLEKKTSLEKLNNEDVFFKEMACDTSKSAFDRLSRGPRQRTDRKERTFVDGTKGDIYRAVLLAIAKTGPKTSLTYEEIRTALRSILHDQVPEAHEITRVLDMMTEISKKDIRGEPVVDYDKELSTLYISDPFFAYYLRWGPDIP